MKLYPFPGAAANQSSFEIHGELRRFPAAAGLEVEFLIQGPHEDLRWLGSGSGQRFETLWEASCLEVFIGAPGHEGYWEWNWTPAGDWAFFEFTRYRERGPGFVPSRPRVASCVGARGLELRAELRNELPPLLRWALATGAGLEFSLNAILDAGSSGRIFFALSHLAEKPDFHLRSAFSGRV